MTFDDLTTAALNPMFTMLPRMDSPQARVMLLAICGQEANLQHRVQVVSGGGRGPAHGLLQFERGGGVRGVMEHPASTVEAKRLCDRLNVAFDRASIWTAIEFQDVLAFGFGRLLLWTDAQPLPAITDREGAWACYLRNWRPGKPHMNTWRKNHLAAAEYVTRGEEA